MTRLWAGQCSVHFQAGARVYLLSPPSEVRLRMGGVMPLPHCMPSWHGQGLRKTNSFQSN